MVEDYMLKPGYIFLPHHPTIISTVLGSSISVCLYDRKTGRGGMNHFLFPRREKSQRPTAMYGNVAVAALVRMMINNGATIKTMEAQIFGGAFLPRTMSWDIGRTNLETARTILKNKKIKIVSEDTGGELGRKIVFNTASFEIAVLRVERLRESDWHPYDPAR
jgi:chemotaxis protein CheD